MARSESGRAALHVAVHADRGGITRLLIEHGCDPEAKRGDDGSTPLHIAVMYGRVAIAQYLLGECGVDMDQKTPEGKSVEDLANGREKPYSEKEPMIRLLAVHRNMRKTEHAIGKVLPVDAQLDRPSRSVILSPL